MNNACICNNCVRKDGYECEVCLCVKHHIVSFDCCGVVKSDNFECGKEHKRGICYECILKLLTIDNGTKKETLYEYKCPFCRHFNYISSALRKRIKKMKTIKNDEGQQCHVMLFKCED